VDRTRRYPRKSVLHRSHAITVAVVHKVAAGDADHAGACRNRLICEEIRTPSSCEGHHFEHVRMCGDNLNRLAPNASGASDDCDPDASPGHR
jgi:hypothetical protein